MGHFNVSLIVWAKSQDSVHKPQFLKRREKGEPKRIEPRFFCLPAKRLTANPHRLTLLKELLFPFNSPAAQVATTLVPRRGPLESATTAGSMGLIGSGQTSRSNSTLNAIGLYNVTSTLPSMIDNRGRTSPAHATTTTTTTTTPPPSKSGAIGTTQVVGSVLKSLFIVNNNLGGFP